MTTAHEFHKAAQEIPLNSSELDDLLTHAYTARLGDKRYQRGPRGKGKLPLLLPSSTNRFEDMLCAKAALS